MNQIMEIKGKHIMVNVWGRQVSVILSTWSEIKKLGFKVRDRAFGDLNDGTPALYFGKWDQETGKYKWYLTTEKLEDIKD